MAEWPNGVFVQIRDLESPGEGSSQTGKAKATWTGDWSVWRVDERGGRCNGMLVGIVETGGAYPAGIRA